MAISFGSGVLTATPLVDSSGNPIANPTPVAFAELQDVSLDYSFENKKLYGNKQFPIAVARGKGSVTAKASVAVFNAELFNAVFFGQTLTAGYTSQVQDVTGVAIPTTPSTITVTPPNSGTFDADMGVRDENGNPMKRVGSAPSVGEYSVSGGTYTFATASAGDIVYINYSYNVADSGSTIAINNQFMGTQPSFRADLYKAYKGESVTFSLFNCSSDKMSFASKSEDFTMPEFSFEAFANNAGNVGTIAFSG